VPQLAVPVLFLASADDAGFADDARTMFASVQEQAKQLEIFPGRAHGTAILSGPDGPRARTLLLEFLRR
jgi:dienelactone hydrolase